MAKEESKAETKKEVKHEVAFELVEIATQTSNVIRDNVNGVVLTIEQALVTLLNDVAAIKKGVVG